MLNTCQSILIITQNNCEETQILVPVLVPVIPKKYF